MEKSVHPSPAARATIRARLAPPFALTLLVGASISAVAQVAGSQAWSLEVQRLASQASLPERARVEVEVGALDPRLKLAPCARITPYVPSGARLWGRSRVGLRCDEGARWNVFVSVIVKVIASGWTASQALPPGTVLEAAHLRPGEVDLAADASPVIREPRAALGRTLARALRPASRCALPT